MPWERHSTKGETELENTECSSLFLSDGYLWRHHVQVTEMQVELCSSWYTGVTLTHFYHCLVLLSDSPVSPSHLPSEITFQMTACTQVLVNSSLEGSPNGTGTQIVCLFLCLFGLISQFTAYSSLLSTTYSESLTIYSLVPKVKQKSNYSHQ